MVTPAGGFERNADHSADELTGIINAFPLA
jgi:hypothetical protein